VSNLRQSAKVAARLIVCGLLLLWIFHSIFTREARDAAIRHGTNWSSLERAEQWRAAWTVGPGELWQNLRAVAPAALALSVLCVGMTIGIGVVRWRMVLKAAGLELSLLRIAEISLVAQFFNSFLLGSTGGDLLKAYYAARETRHLKAEAVTTVFVDRLLGLFSMLLFACLMMVPNLALLQDHKRLGAVAVFTVLMTLACGAVVWLALRGGVSQRWPAARAWLRRLPKAEALERSLESCRQFGRDPALLAWFIGLSIALNFFCVLQVIVLAKGLGLAIPTVALFVIVPIIICIAALPITPSGLGIRENLYVLVLAVPVIAVPETSALSLSLLIFVGGLLWSALGGVVYLWLKDSQHLAEVARGETGEPPVKS